MTNEWKYFKLEDFACQETGENEMLFPFITRLDHLRHVCGFPFIVTSGYRSKEHSAEKSKPAGSIGQHTLGLAVDIAIRNSSQRYAIVSNATKLGFTGIGIAKTFVHVDTRATDPVMWFY